MNYLKLFNKKGFDLRGKTVAITGATGGIGIELCSHLSSLGASLILIDRNENKSRTLRENLKNKTPNLKVMSIIADMENEDSVKEACEKLTKQKIDFFIINAGAYSIPIKTCESGFNNVFEINFLSPYYMINSLLPHFRECKTCVVAVSSIAINYSKIAPDDIDFSKRSASSLKYGNSKRFLTYSLFELFRNETETTLSIAHPGITFTNITSHYPKLIFALIKHPMKIIFMKPKKACLSILYALFEPCFPYEWIGPKFFNIWGSPKKKRLKGADKKEIETIFLLSKDVLKRHK